MKLLQPDLPLELLTTLEQKVELLSGFPVDHVLIFQTSPALLSLTAQEFWNQLLVERLQVRGLVEGRNFFFGRKREGSVAHLQEWSVRQGIALEVVHDVYRRGRRISSSLIRELIKAGEVEQARQALGRPYSLSGIVQRGDQRGQQLGFPTANLHDIPTLIPEIGVYAALAHSEKATFAAAVNIGPNPTFGVHAFKVEAHLLDYAGDLYGKRLTLEVYARLRTTQPFASVAALKEQLVRDLKQTRQILTPELEKVRGKSVSA